jgi:class 3 adenylate cyclase/predicted ATPase/DNA polymerase III delta prime subunit
MRDLPLLGAEDYCMDIAGWLRGLGLEQYAQLFRDNDIDGEILCGMTAEDLREMGISSFGHRRRLLNAITALGGEPPTRDVAQSATRATSAPTSSPAIEAERRQLTVMFCDLVGSTALSTRHDPEDLRELIGDYHRAVSETIGRFDGFVAKYMGDGVLIYFGYPRAHEDDAERAVRAGLAVIEAVGRLPAREDLRVRVGIATGLVVVGDLIGEGSAREQAVVGETPNLAARLQALAEPASLVIGDATRRQIGGLFDLEDLGPQQLAGFAEPQRAWRVLGESGAVSRFEALRSGETPLVGREEEVELLIRRWQQAKSGEGRVVLISGEPGIGKSRLTAALSEHIVAEPHIRLRYFCSPHHQDSALYPFIAHLERAAGFARDDTVEARLDKLRALLAHSTRDDNDFALFAELLSLPSSTTDLNLSPQRKREKLFEAILSQLEAEARHRPVLMVFEDAHWIDPTTRELLDLTVDRVRHLPVLLAITFRPEFPPPWSGRSHVMSLALNRLGERDGEALVQKLAGNAALAPDVVAEIVERTDGVPLFVEELTKAVLESAGQGDRVAAVLATTSPAAQSVPATLHASLMARLDRLGAAAKEVAQAGAAIGREFSYELLAPVSGRGEVELMDALDRLTDASLVFRRGIPPQATYLFKHALVRDAAYSTLLRTRRQEIHAGIAATLEREFPEAVAAQPEVLAHHCTEAGLTDQAIKNWHRAGERAVERATNLEAIAHLNRGLEVLKVLPGGPQREEQELPFQIALLAPLWASKGFASPGAWQVAARAVELCERLGGHLPEHIRALWGLAAFQMVCGELRTGFAAGKQCLELAKQLQDRGLLGYAQFLMGDFLLWFGELACARAHLEQGIALYDPERARVEASRFGFQDNSSACHSFLGRVLWHFGYPEQALVNSDRALAIAENSAHPFSAAHALSWAAALHQLRGEVGQSQKLAEADLALSTEQVIPFFAAHAMVFRGWTLVKQGQSENGIAQLREGLVAYRATGAELESSHWLGLLAEACRDTGQTEEGLRVVAEALDHVARTGIVYYEAELHRLNGELRLRLDAADTKSAETSFRRAIDIAQRQQAKSWELRAATNLARLLSEQGRNAEARELLAPIYGWFTEGFDTADLKEAKALLDELM